MSERDSTYDYPRTRPEFSGVFGRAIPPCTPQPSEKLSTITSNFDNDRYGTVSDDTYSGGSKLRLSDTQGSTSVLQNVFDELGKKRNLGNIDNNMLSSPYNTAKIPMKRYGF